MKKKFDNSCFTLTVAFMFCTTGDIISGAPGSLEPQHLKMLLSLLQTDTIPSDRSQILLTLGNTAAFTVNQVPQSHAFLVVLQVTLYSERAEIVVIVPIITLCTLYIYNKIILLCQIFHSQFAQHVCQLTCHVLSAVHDSPVIPAHSVPPLL